MNRFDLRRRELFEPGIRVGPQPGSSELAALLLSGFGEEFFFVFSLRRIFRQPTESYLLYRAIALRAPDHRPARHEAAMTFRAGCLANLNLAPLPNYVTCK